MIIIRSCKRTYTFTVKHEIYTWDGMQTGDATLNVQIFSRHTYKIFCETLITMGKQANSFIAYTCCMYAVVLLIKNNIQGGVFLIQCVHMKLWTNYYALHEVVQYFLIFRFVLSGHVLTTITVAVVVPSRPPTACVLNDRLWCTVTITKWITLLLFFFLGYLFIRFLFRCSFLLLSVSCT